LKLKIHCIDINPSVLFSTILHVPKKIINVFIEHKSPLVFIVLSILAYWFAAWLTIFEFNRDALSEFELWRLFTSHFYHTNLNHLLLNCLAVILLWAIHGQYYQAKYYWFLFVIASLITSLGLYLFSDIQLYVGLSGILHGYFLWGALKDIEHKEYTGYLLLLGLVGKLAYEQTYGASAEVASFINANVAVDGHLYGAVSGLIFYTLIKLKS
jgi:rhomboid family GlyGly-CTERM serine protease